MNNRQSNTADSGPTKRPPSVDKVLNCTGGQLLITRFGRTAVTKAIRHQLDLLREHQHTDSAAFPDIEEILTLVNETLEQDNQFTLKRVLNLTGTVLHTNLGRAVLPSSALQAVIDVASGACNLEYEIDNARRGDRDSHIESLIIDLTGAEAATVVNNNAAAVLLVLNTLAFGKEVPVSRGELVEIGGSFRIPDIMSRSGCHLVEIGTTNRTHSQDYRAAIGQNTALLMKVHTSNYKIRGFTNTVSDAEVATIAHEFNLPFITDLGSGSLIDLHELGLPDEPTVSTTLNSGADIVTFSGDKLLGGPQAGIIVGKSKYIERIKSNPMKRALRLDKLAIAALYGTLKLYKDPNRLTRDLPVLHFLTRTSEEIMGLARELIAPVSQKLSGIAEVSIVDTKNQTGSGSLPLELLPGHGICIRPLAQGDIWLRQLAAAFRQLPVPMIGRLHDGSLLFDLRTLEHSNDVLSQLDHLDIPQRDED